MPRRRWRQSQRIRPKLQQLERAFKTNRARKTSTNTVIFLVNTWARAWLRGALLRFSANSTRACLRVAASARIPLSCAFDTATALADVDRSTRRRP